MEKDHNMQLVVLQRGWLIWLFFKGSVSPKMVKKSDKFFERNASVASSLGYLGKG